MLLSHCVMSAPSAPQTIPIDDAADGRIEVYRDIRERDVTGRGGLIAEGTVVVEQLLRSSRFEATSLFILRNRLAGLADLLATVPPNVPVYVAERAVMDEIAGFAIHRGVLAHGRRRQPAAGTDLAERVTDVALTGAPVIVAVGIANHDNIGAIFRNAAAFGAGMVLLDGTSCDPLYRKAIRVSAGSILHVPFERIDGALEARALLAQAGFSCLALTPSGGTGLLDCRPTGPVALFLGAEGPGLPGDVIEAMTGVRIEMAGGFDSLNVATAGAIALHHLAGRRLR